MVTGTISRLWRWPVKSMAGEEVATLRLDGHGVGGDRAHAVLHEHKGEWKPLTAREAPGLLAWSAAYGPELNGGVEPANPPQAILTPPDRRRSWRWDDPELRAVLERDLGRPVRLLREPTGVPDVADHILVTAAGTLRALAEELGKDVDLRRFRPNLHLELDSPAWAEESWIGAEVSFEGGVRLELTESCERCAIPTRDPDTREKWPDLLKHLAARHGQNFGVLARVAQGGTVATGEAVRIDAGTASVSTPSRR
jgi:hypothetical protein